MLKAEITDREAIVSILTASFEDNKSVNYLIRQDNKRINRIRSLMAYSFDYCRLHGDIYLNTDKTACALLLYPLRNKLFLRDFILDIRLVFSCIGLSRVVKAIKRESEVKKGHPATSFCHLWFIGVHPDVQHRGKGSALLKEIIDKHITVGLPIYLETSNPANVRWYARYGFSIFRELDFGYSLSCLRKEI